VPRVAAVNRIQGDMLGRPAAAARIAGPLADLAAGSSWTADPRRATSPR